MDVEVATAVVHRSVSILSPRVVRLWKARNTLWKVSQSYSSVQWLAAAEVVVVVVEVVIVVDVVVCGPASG
jgi:hypothetical protein